MHGTPQAPMLLSSSSSLWIAWSKARRWSSASPSSALLLATWGWPTTTGRDAETSGVKTYYKMWVCLTSVNTLNPLVNHHVPPFKKAMPGGFAIFRHTHMTKEAPKAVRPPLWGAAPSAQDGTKSMAENVFLPLLDVPWLLPSTFS